MLGALGVAQHADHRYEADDILGTFALRSQEEGWDGLILTGDRDALQLVAGGVTMCILRRGAAETDVYTPATLLKTWGLITEVAMVDSSFCGPGLTARIFPTPLDHRLAQ